MKSFSHAFIVLAFGALTLTPPTTAGQSVSAAKPGTAVPPQTQQGSNTQMPNTPGSLKFAVLGDFGVGTKQQYQLADQMAKTYAAFPFEIVVLVGDNLYGSERPQDFKSKFEIPYKPLLDKGVKFYASLGNHDDRAEQIKYKLFNMNGNLHYTLRAPHQNARFFMFESTYPEPDQIAWLEKELKDSKEDWKIPVFHHPLYSSGERHGSDTQLRDVLEPLFVKYGVSVVLTGHDHFYERVKPQKGITYFVVGSGGQLRPGNIDRGTGLTAAGFDTDNAFMIAEIVGDTMTFQAIARSGKVVDAGSFTRRDADQKKDDKKDEKK